MSIEGGLECEECESSHKPSKGFGSSAGRLGLHHKIYSASV
ncbi:MAG: hypothetical protein QXR59_03145 [Candidatus Bathyarchaeia archaeon]